jgi:hypothetical protein
METRKRRDLIRFLKEELALPASDIELAMRHSEFSSLHLPMILWQYGLVTLTQLEQIFDWLDQQIS